MDCDFFRIGFDDMDLLNWTNDYVNQFDNEETADENYEEISKKLIEFFYDDENRTAEELHKRLVLIQNMVDHINQYVAENMMDFISKMFPLESAKNL